MKIRKISSHYIFNGETQLLKFGILEMDKTGVIQSVKDTGGMLTERAGLEFYNGLMMPCLLAGNITDLIETLRSDSSNRHQNIELPDQLWTFHSEIPYPLTHQQTLQLLSVLYDCQQLWPEESRLFEFLTHFTARAVEKIIDSPFGSFAPGKKPGILILENIDLLRFKLRAITQIRMLG
jgi:hypothetical protein